MRLASGETIDADVVVVNADLAMAEGKLLPSSWRRSTYDDRTMAEGQVGLGKWRYSTSSVTFLWCLKRPFPELTHHNVFLATDGTTNEANDHDPYRAAWEAVLVARGGDVGTFPPQSPSGRFNFYVCRASDTDPTAAPTGADKYSSTTTHTTHEEQFRLHRGMRNAKHDTQNLTTNSMTEP